MTTLNKLSEVDKQLVTKLLKEYITKTWVIELLLGKKGIHSLTGHINLTFEECFEILLWDNLSTEQKKQLINTINSLLKETLDKSIYDSTFIKHLVGLACLLENKIKYSMDPILIEWKNKGFPNLTTPTNYETSLHKEFSNKIAQAFLKN